MKQKNSPPGSAPLMQSLEGRRMLSVAATTTLIEVGPPTALLGQNLDIEVIVTSKSKSSVRGDVAIYDNKSFVAEGPLTDGSVGGTISSVFNGVGGNAFYNGKNVFTADFLGSRNFSPSKSHDADVTVSMPKLAKERHGLKIATVLAGSGPAATAGTQVTVAYTGYLTNGTIFDSTELEINQGNSPGTLTFTLTKDIYSSGLIAGFDEGILGMLPGETRVLDIPASLGYGSNANGPIPANSELIFVVSRQYTGRHKAAS